MGRILGILQSVETRLPLCPLVFLSAIVLICLLPVLMLTLWVLWGKMTFFCIVHTAGEVGTYCSPFSLVGELLSFLFLYTAKVVVVGGNTHKVRLTNLNAFKFTCFLLHWSTGTSLETWNSTKARSTMCICPIQHFPGDVAEGASDWFIGSYQLHSPC